MATTAGVGRPCTVCTHPDRALIEAELDGAEGYAVPSLSMLARRHGLGSPHALRRHVKNHLAPAVRAALEPREGVDASTVLTRVLSAADAARTVRLTAERVGHRPDALRAISVEVQALTVLSTRLGVDSEWTAKAVAEAQRLATAVGDAVRADAGVGEAIARALDHRGAWEMAETLRREFESVSGNEGEARDG